MVCERPFRDMCSGWALLLWPRHTVIYMYVWLCLWAQRVAMFTCNVAVWVACTMAGAAPRCRMCARLLGRPLEYSGWTRGGSLLRSATCSLQAAFEGQVLR
jgi:hypothetical protein